MDKPNIVIDYVNKFIGAVDSTDRTIFSCKRINELVLKTDCPLFADQLVKCIAYIMQCITPNDHKPKSYLQFQRGFLTSQVHTQYHNR